MPGKLPLHPGRLEPSTGRTSTSADPFLKQAQRCTTGKRQDTALGRLTGPENSNVAQSRLTAHRETHSPRRRSCVNLIPIFFPKSCPTPARGAGSGGVRLCPGLAAVALGWHIAATERNSYDCVLYTHEQRKDWTACL